MVLTLVKLAKCSMVGEIWYNRLIVHNGHGINLYGVFMILRAYRGHSVRGTLSHSTAAKLLSPACFTEFWS